MMSLSLKSALGAVLGCFTVLACSSEPPECANYRAEELRAFVRVADRNKNLARRAADHALIADREVRERLLESSRLLGVSLDTFDEDPWLNRYIDAVEIRVSQNCSAPKLP